MRRTRAAFDAERPDDGDGDLEDGPSVGLIDVNANDLGVVVAASLEQGRVDLDRERTLPCTHGHMYAI
jgi:hypothetical protein